MMKSTQIIPGLNAKVIRISRLGYPEKFFHEMMENLDRETLIYTDMVLVCPQDGISLRVSKFSASFVCLLKIIKLRIKGFSC